MALHARLRAELAAEFAGTRSRTLALAAAARDEYCRQVHPYYSPMGWHLGHVGMTEALWVLGRAKGEPPLRPDLELRFANVRENPKASRHDLPPYAEILAYLDAVRARVLDFLTV